MKHATINQDDKIDLILVLISSTMGMCAWVKCDDTQIFANVKLFT